MSRRVKVTGDSTGTYQTAPSTSDVQHQAYASPRTPIRTR